MRNKVHKYSIFSFGTLIFCKKEIGLVEGTVPHIVRGDMFCCFLRRSQNRVSYFLKYFVLFIASPISLSLSLSCAAQQFMPSNLQSQTIHSSFSLSFFHSVNHTHQSLTLQSQTRRAHNMMCIHSHIITYHDDQCNS